MNDKRARINKFALPRFFLPNMQAHHIRDAHGNGEGEDSAMFWTRRPTSYFTMISNFTILLNFVKISCFILYHSLINHNTRCISSTFKFPVRTIPMVHNIQMTNPMKTCSKKFHLRKRAREWRGGIESCLMEGGARLRDPSFPHGVVYVVDVDVVRVCMCVCVWERDRWEKSWCCCGRQINTGSFVVVVVHHKTTLTPNETAAYTRFYRIRVALVVMSQLVSTVIPRLTQHRNFAC